MNYIGVFDDLNDTFSIDFDDDGDLRIPCPLGSDIDASNLYHNYPENPTPPNSR